MEINYDLLATTGTILVALAYLPQIVHLAREHCAYGISVRAWGIWLFAALLILPHSLYLGDKLFTSILIIQIIATGFVWIYSFFHQNTVCQYHFPKIK